MQINSIQNTSFGQIFVSPTMLENIKKYYKAMPKDKRPDKATFNRNWERCQDTKEFDLLITDKREVFLLDKKGQRVMQETMLSRFVWNIDSALKRILLFEDAVPHEHHKVTKYD